MAQSRPLPLVVTTAPWATHIVLQSEAATQIWRSYLIDDDIFDETRRRRRRAPGRERPGVRRLRHLHERARDGGIRPVLGAARVHSRSGKAAEARRSAIPGMVFGRCSNASADFHPRL